MTQRSSYESQAMIALYRDAQQRIATEGAKNGLFSLLNQLIVESVTKDLWRYNTPTLMVAAELLNELVTNQPRGDVPLMIAMDGFVKNLNALDNSPEQLTELLHEAIAKVQLEMKS